MAAPGDKLWLAASKSMKEVGSVGRCQGTRGNWAVSISVVASGSGHEEAALVEQKACGVHKHVNGEGVFAVHKVADEDE